MSEPAKPSLEDVARRNAAVTPERVRQMQETVKRLRDLGVLKEPTYGIQPGLGERQIGSQRHWTMNRISDT